MLSAAVLDEREIRLIANEPGISSLHIWTRNGINRRIKVNVMPAETARVSREIGAFLANIPNSKVTVIGDKLVVEGEQLAGTANSPPIVNPLGGVPLLSSLNVLSVLNLGLNAQLPSPISSLPWVDATCNTSTKATVAPAPCGTAVTNPR